MTTNCSWKKKRKKVPRIGKRTKKGAAVEEKGRINEFLPREKREERFHFSKIYIQQEKAM